MTRIAETIHGWLGWCPQGSLSARKSNCTLRETPVARPVVQNTNHRGPVTGDPSGNLPYEHTQRGDMMIAIFSLAIIVIIAAQFLGGFVWVAGVVLGILLIVLLLFSTLTITVDFERITIRFGPVGLLKKSWLIEEVESAVPIKNPWYYGLGIHWTPRGILYNVSGSGGVEVRLYSGALFRIGSDEPEVVCRAICHAYSSDTGGGQS